MKDAHISIQKIKENHIQNQRNLANFKRNHSEAQFLNVETRSLTHSDLFEKTEKENHPYDKIERQSSITRIANLNVLPRQAGLQSRQISEKSSSKEVERYLNTIDSLNHLISNNFKLEKQLQKKGTASIASQKEKYSSLAQEQQKKIIQLEQLVQRLHKIIKEKAKESNAFKQGQFYQEKITSSFNLKKLQLQQQNAQLSRLNKILSDKSSRLEADLHNHFIEYQQKMTILQGQKKHLIQMLQDLQIQKKQGKNCSCKYKQKYLSDQKRELKILKDELKMMNGQLAYCRQELEASKQSLRKQTQTVKTAGEMLQDLQELYKAIVQKAERQGKQYRIKIQSLQKTKQISQSKIQAQDIQISELKAQIQSLKQLKQN